MAETQFKRQREEEEEEEQVIKRQKSYKDILSILDEDEDESTQDLSSLITTLQQEISSSDDESTRTSINDQVQFSSSSSETDSCFLEDEAGKVIRHLLEASDDELGIPTTAAGVMEVAEIDCGDWLLPVNVAGGDGLWEIEDEAANYYTLLQSELFL